jgi:DNA topoisomerase-1
LAVSTAAPKRLVIVESPAKAKTIGKYLGAGYQVLASVGHIRDLPRSAAETPAQIRGQDWADIAVDVTNGFLPYYVVSSDKRSTVKDLKAALAGADELLLATDEDREGEAIAWHLMEVLKPKVPVRRMVFHEITPEAISQALASTRDIDEALVDAQETRRIVDRLVGYRVSPVLWRKIGVQNLSAGRVQSVAVRLIVQRERERMAFVTAGYADVRGTFDPGRFDARLTAVDDRRVATGRDFDDRGGLKSEALVLTLPQAQELAAGIADAAFAVDSVQEKPGTKRPAPPFITSTLQQEAGRRLRWTSQRTMGVAQGLYERGFITYMRTDSVTLSAQALTAARQQAAALYGADHVHPTVRTYRSRSANAQEAHEAIRPAGDVFRTPAEVAGQLVGDDFTLYDMIWKRTVASQMADAKVSTTTFGLSAVAQDGRRARFTASGTVVTFAGFLAAYEETAEEDRNAEDRVDNARLPRLAVGDTVTPVDLGAVGHATKPPARYNDASLVKALEELGIGRPSTYHSIIATIQSRGYVMKKGGALAPTFLAFGVIQLLEQHFAQLVDYDFTRRVEDVLDAISRGEQERVDALTRFWQGDPEMAFDGLVRLLERLGEIDARAVSTVTIPGTEVVARVGKYGPYLMRPDTEEKANLSPEMAPGDLTAEMAEDLLARGSNDRELGRHPETGRELVAREGRYGPYLTEVLPPDAPKGAKPRTASLIPPMTVETLTLQDALRLLSLPRVVGVDPGTGEEITAQNGRYGPYLRRGTDSRTLPSTDLLFTIGLEEALAVFAQPKRGRGAAAAPGKPLGEDPASGAPVELKSGRYGYYVTDGTVNATLRSADDPETITLDRAAELLAEKRAKGPAPKKRAAKKAPAKKAPAKKAPAKKAAATKAPAKKAPAKKAAATKATAKQAAPPLPEPDTVGAPWT